MYPVIKLPTKLTFTWTQIRCFHRDVRCLFEVGISKVMFAQVGLLVHALSILNFGGLYKIWGKQWSTLSFSRLYQCHSELKSRIKWYFHASSNLTGGIKCRNRNLCPCCLCQNCRNLTKLLGIKHLVISRWHGLTICSLGVKCVKHLFNKNSKVSEH